MRRLQPLRYFVELEHRRPVRKLLGTWNQATPHRIHVHVLPEAGKFSSISDSVVIETGLPDFSQKAQFLFGPKEKAPLMNWTAFSKVTGETGVRRA
jgi:hypothetical protein